MANREREAVAALQDRAGAIEANGRDLAAFYAEAVGEEQVELLPTLEDIESMARGPGLTPRLVVGWLVSVPVVTAGRSPVRTSSSRSSCGTLTFASDRMVRPSSRLWARREPWDLH